MHLVKDFEGEPRDPYFGRDYFKKRFIRLANKAGRSKEREIYTQSVAFFVVVTFSTEAWPALPLQRTLRYCG
jgi:hypothetical protein